MTLPSSERLRPGDYLLLAAFCLALFLSCAFTAKRLTGHESVLAENSREMLADGDWIVPKVGGEPWLERPPCPDWLICTVYQIAGTSESDSVARIAAVLVAVPTVLLVAMIASRFYGRAAGLIAGGVFATMHEMYAYASNPEADIFLCLIVTATIALFVRQEFGSVPEGSAESGSPVGRRSWTVLAFFLMLGATNLAKGVVFGTVMAGLPIAGYLLWNGSWGQVRRYVWVWGWLAALAVAAAWPAAVIVQHPEIRDLWREHYFNRLNGGYLREPWWYYALNVPYVLLPWTLPAVIGLWRSRRAAFAAAGPERFLWCWAILPPLVFSLSDGKHHHYLLQCMAPWAILAANGTAAVWRFGRERMPAWVQSPWPATALAAIVSLVLLNCRIKYDVPRSVVEATAAALPVLAFVLARAIAHPNPRAAFTGVLLVLAVTYSGWTTVRAAVRDSYEADAEMLQRAAAAVPDGAPLMVHYDWVRPLETFWVLYHTPRSGLLVRDAWEAKEKASGDEAFVLARRLDAPLLSEVGTLEPLVESEHTRLEPSPEYRRVLYRVKFHATTPPAPADLLTRTRRTLW